MFKNITKYESHCSKENEGYLQSAVKLRVLDFRSGIILLE